MLFVTCIVICNTILSDFLYFSVIFSVLDRFFNFFYKKNSNTEDDWNVETRMKKSESVEIRQYQTNNSLFNVDIFVSFRCIVKLCSNMPKLISQHRTTVILISTLHSNNTKICFYNKCTRQFSLNSGNMTALVSTSIRGDK